MDSQEINFNSLIQIYDSFSDIKFLDKNHKYEIAGKPAKKSVSGLINSYEKSFDAENKAKNTAAKDGVTVDDVLKKWQANKNYSCHKGSEFHRYVENFLERRQLPIDKKALINHLDRPFDDPTKVGEWDEDRISEYYKEMALLIKNFKGFYDWWKEDHILIKSEFVIGDKEYGVCGTIDNLSFNKKTNEFAIFDYKTNKEIRKKGYNDERMFKPFDHIPKCEYSKYSLQLSLYRLLFEKNCPFKIAYSGIVWLAGKDNYELISPLDYSKEAAIMLVNA